MVRNKSWIGVLLFFSTLILSAPTLWAGEADINIPDLSRVHFGGLTGMTILYAGLVICLLGAVFGWVQYLQTRALPVHPRMSDVSNIIWETCKTYLFTQGKFLVALWI